MIGQHNSILGFDLFGSYHPTAGISHYQTEQMQIAEMLAISPTKAVYKSVINWTSSPGAFGDSVSCFSFHDRDARKQALRAAIRSGWTYPRWWQFWRWNDTRPNLDFRQVDAAA